MTVLEKAAGAATICAPLRLERAALRARRSGSALRVVRTGMGPLRATEFAEDRFAAADPGEPVVVAGIGGGLAPGLRAGDIVVASAVRGVSGQVVPVPSAPLLANELRRLGLRVHVGPIVSSPAVVDGPARRRLADTGALAVDMESLWLAEAAGDRPLAVLRSIVDTPEHPLWRPGTLGRGVAGLRALRRAVPALAAWARATGPREVVLATAGEGVEQVEAGQFSGVPRGSGLVLGVDDVSEVDLAALAGARRVVIAAGAQAPPERVRELLESLAGLGPVSVHDTRRGGGPQFAFRTGAVPGQPAPVRVDREGI